MEKIITVEVCCDNTCENYNKSRERELTVEEIAEREAMAAQAEADRVAQEAEAATKAAEKAALLAKLGITEDEAKLLLNN